MQLLCKPFYTQGLSYIIFIHIYVSTNQNCTKCYHPYYVIERKAYNLPSQITVMRWMKERMVMNLLSFHWRLRIIPSLMYFMHPAIHEQLFYHIAISILWKWHHDLWKWSLHLRYFCPIQSVFARCHWFQVRFPNIVKLLSKVLTLSHLHLFLHLHFRKQKERMN